MGGFMHFQCTGCDYREERIPYGRGLAGGPELRLFRCDACKSIGSTWVGEGREAACGYCYEEGVALLEPAAGTVRCPRCGESGRLEPAGGKWE